MRYRPTEDELLSLKSALVLRDPQLYQRAIQTWYLKQDPGSGEVRELWTYPCGCPNRTTPETVAVLLDSLEVQTDLASAALDEYESAGIPLLTDKTPVPQLRGEIEGFREELSAYREQNDAALDRGIGDTVEGDEIWQEGVMLPLLTREGLGFMQPLILTRAANVGKASIEGAMDDLWSDLKQSTTITTGGVSLLALAAGGLALALILRR